VGALAARTSWPPGAELDLIEPLYCSKEDVMASSLHSHRTRTAHPVGQGGLAIPLTHADSVSTAAVPVAPVYKV